MKKEEDDQDWSPSSNRLSFGLVLYHRRKDLRLVDHLLNHLLSRDYLGKMFLLIDLGHLCNEVGGDPVLEFLHSVDSGCLE